MLFYFSGTGVLLVLIWLLSQASLIINRFFEHPASYAWTCAFLGRYADAPIVIAAIGAFVAAGTLWTINNQLNATFNDERPWIKVDGTIDQTAPFPIEFSSIVAPIPFVAKLTNTGKSPALNVRVYALSYIPYPNGNMFEDQRKRCKELSERPLGDWNNGYTLFPNDFVVDGQQNGITGGPWPGISPEQLQNVPVGGTFQIYIFGCADYVSTFDKSHHQTGFIYQVAKQSKGERTLDISFTRTEKFTVDELRLVRFPSETGTY